MSYQNGETGPRLVCWFYLKVLKMRNDLVEKSKTESCAICKGGGGEVNRDERRQV